MGTARLDMELLSHSDKWWKDILIIEAKYLD